jgi:hypothetical protein
MLKLASCRYAARIKQITAKNFENSSNTLNQEKIILYKPVSLRVPLRFLAALRE